MNVTTKRRADEFAQLLEAGARTDDPAVAPLLAVAAALGQVHRAADPRPEFRAQLRQRLVAVAAVQVSGTAAETPLSRVRAAGATWRVQRRMTAVAAGAAVITAVAGVGIGSSRSLPGQPLYGMKRAAESAQLATTFGTEERGKRHLEFARTRLAEVKALAAGDSSALGPVGRSHLLAAASAAGNTAQLLSTLRAMDVETRDGANDLFVAFRDSGSGEPLRALDRFTAKQYGDLRALVPGLPASVQPRAQSSLSLLALVSADTHALAVRAASTPAPAPGTTPTKAANASPGATSSATGGSPTPGSRTTPRRSSPGVVLPTDGLPTSGLPSAGPNTPVTIPSIGSVPASPSSPLPTSLPPLPDLSQLPGLLGH